MKILLISKDTKLFCTTSTIHKELLECAKKVEEIHVIVQTIRKEKLSFRKIENNIFLYPTNSFHPLFFIYDTFVTARLQLTNKFHLIVDLISADYGFAMIVAAYFISWKYGKKYFINIHQNHNRSSADDNIFIRIAREDFRHYFFRKAVGIRVPSQEIGEEIYRSLPHAIGKIYILPDVSDIEEIRQSPPKKNIHLIFKKFNIILIQITRTISFSSIIRAKKIMKELKKRYPKIGLIIVGKVKNNFLNWPRKFFLPKNIILKKRIFDFESYYKTANAFIDTSDITDADKQNEVEFTDAIFAGCPMVATKTVANDNLIREGENGFIVDPNDSKKFARKIIDILERNGLREQMKLYHLNITELYGKDINGYIDRLVNIWETCKSTEEKNAHIDRFVKPFKIEETKYFRAITMSVMPLIKKKIINSSLRFTTNPQEGDLNYVFDVDKIKIGIEEAIQELENESSN